MTIVGKVESLWRYPGKSMRGEELEEALAASPSAEPAAEPDRGGMT